MDPLEGAPPEAMLSRRRLLVTSAKMTAAAAALLGAGPALETIPIPVEDLPRLTEEIAGHWTTF